MQLLRVCLVAALATLLAIPALAQGFFEAEEPSVGEQLEVRSTYIIELDPSVSFGEVEGRARGLAARFNGQIKHVYGHAYRGFAVRMSSVALSRLLSAENTDVIRATRDDFVTIAEAPPCKGSNKNDPGCSDAEEPVDGGATGGSCDELVWGVAQVTRLQANSDCVGYTDTDPNRFYDEFEGGLKVCVIDTGVDPDHLDLNVDTDRHNFSGDSSDDDLHGHGTHVAGTIAAIANDEGVVGVAPGAVITSIKVLDRNGSGAWSDVIAGVDKAAEIGCDVANMSLGGGGYTPLDDAVACATTNACGPSTSPVMFSIAAGNSSVDTDNYSPARASVNDDTDGVYTIAAFGEGDEWASFSNYNDDETLGEPDAPLVEFALPGVSIKSTLPNNSYGTYNGTSMAAPHMAGLLVRYLVDGGKTGPIANSAINTNGVVDRVSTSGRGRWSTTTSYEGYDIPVTP